MPSELCRNPIGGLMASSPRRALLRIPPGGGHAERAVRLPTWRPLSQQQTAPYIAFCGCTVTIVSEESPHCGQSGRVRRVFWRQRVPWVVLRLRLGGIVALPWASTDLLAPPLETGPRADEAATALLSPIAMRDLARFVLKRPGHARMKKTING